MATPSFDSHGDSIAVEAFLPPASASKRPAIVVAHGTAGMDGTFGVQIRSFASDLAAEGFVVLIPHFFGEVPAGELALAAFQHSSDRWVQILQDALAHAADSKDVESGNIGLLGFSMGGHLALRAAKAPGGVKVRALVEFFAPIQQPPLFNGIGGNLEKLPPLLIHHGEADGTVDISQTDLLEKLLVAAGKKLGPDYQIERYKNEGHGFKGDTAVKKSKKLTADFFKKLLHKPVVRGASGV